MTDIHSLFRMPLDPLMLSQTTIKALKWDGITSIGDCLLFFYRHATGGWVSPGLIVRMYDEVRSSLTAQGCWSLVNNADVWQALKQRDVLFRRIRIACWEGRDRELDEIQIEELDLSVRGFNTLKRTGITTLGECVDLYYIEPGSAMDYPSPKLAPVMFGELEQKLREYGYWSFIEAHRDALDW